MTLLMREQEKYQMGIAKGRAEGRVETIFKLVSDGLLPRSVGAMQLGMSEKEFEIKLMQN